MTANIVAVYTRSVIKYTGLPNFFTIKYIMLIASQNANMTRKPVDG